MSQTNISFEESLRKLEQIVRLMEKGDVPLDESLKLFREGAELVASCEKLLNDAKLQVHKILADSQGSPVEEELAYGNEHE